MKKGFSILVALVATVCLAAAPASAAKWVTTFYGTVDEGEDLANLFPGGFLGENFMFTVTSELDDGTRTTGSGTDDLTNGPTNPFSDMTFTVGSTAYAMTNTGGGLGLIGGSQGSFFGSSVIVNLASGLVPGSLETAFDVTGSGTGSFAFGDSYASFSVNRMTHESVAVPEPGTWALMILGFGAAGAMLRRRPLAA